MNAIEMWYQEDMFIGGHFLMIPMDAPEWAHKILHLTCTRDPGAYQIVNGSTTMVGYEYLNQEAMQYVANTIQREEQRRFAQLLLTPPLEV